MKDIHDERRVPLEFESAVTPGELEHRKTMARLKIEQRNRRDEIRAGAVEKNEADRITDAKRKLRQPGLTDEQRQAALVVLGRVGGGK